MKKRKELPEAPEGFRWYIGKNILGSYALYLIYDHVQDVDSQLLRDIPSHRRGVILFPEHVSYSGKVIIYMAPRFIRRAARRVLKKYNMYTGELNMQKSIVGFYPPNKLSDLA